MSHLLFWHHICLIFVPFIFRKLINNTLFGCIAVYRIYTSIIFHGSLLHVLFNMLALVPLGSELERIMGSIRLFFMIILLATSNAIFHLVIALLVAHNPFHPFPFLMHECAIGFSGILFSMIVIETSLSGVQSRRLVFSTKIMEWQFLVPFHILQWTTIHYPISSSPIKMHMHVCVCEST